MDDNGVPNGELVAQAETDQVSRNEVHGKLPPECDPCAGQCIDCGRFVDSDVLYQGAGRCDACVVQAAAKAGAAARVDFKSGKPLGKNVKRPKQWQQKRREHKVWYVNHFVQSHCSADMLGLRLFPNAKEITESWACFEATTKLGPGFEWDNPDVTVVVVGDGCTPRTAATFAMRSAWQAISVDPKLSPRLAWKKIKRLETQRCRVQDMAPVKCDTALIVLPHAHVTLEDAVSRVFANKRAVISLECCVKQRTIFEQEPHVQYEDEFCWSPRNTVRVWRELDVDREPVASISTPTDDEFHFVVMENCEACGHETPEKALVGGLCVACLGASK